MDRKIISTTAAPAAIGTYSQAVKADNTVYLSGQIPLDPESGALIDGDTSKQIMQVFDNISAVAAASGGTLGDIIKLNIYLTDLQHFSLVNEIMADYFTAPYPARAVVGIAELPKGALVEMDAIMVIA